LKDTYKVPEIAEQKYIKRKQFYEQLQESDIDMGWIHTDPRGYIEITKQVNEKNKNKHKQEQYLLQISPYHVL
jgi:hypothetical protein